MKTTERIDALIFNGEGKHFQLPVCCESMRRSLIHGTDSEGNGPLARGHGHGVPYGITAGVDLPNLRFCPWCGVKLDQLDWISS